MANEPQWQVVGAGDDREVQRENSITYTRRNVYAKGGNFSDPTILWYARGIAAMKARPLADPTSWRFYAAIHGFNEELWRTYGYLTASDRMPTRDQIDLYWDQCQHGSWYFLPWHRGYVLALEEMVRHAIAPLGGPTDWALPYWNYLAPNENDLPPAFATRDWPDGKGDNPLFVEQRWGPDHDREHVYVPPGSVDRSALEEPHFTGVPSGGNPGFGGIARGFTHLHNPHGKLERQPHDIVHSVVGGTAPKEGSPGLMAVPGTAGLDPIFFLHHTNIDRLWEIWLRGPISRGNPTEPAWLDGPVRLGERRFVMPRPDGTEWRYTPGQIADLAKLGYTYDDLTTDAVTPAPRDRMARLRARLAASSPTEGTAAMDSRAQNVELLGASRQPLRIAGRKEARTSVELEDAVRRKVTESFASAANEEASAVPDRLFLNLENVRSFSDAVAFQVYVNLPEGANPADHPERAAGSVALFGVTAATDPDGHGGGGQTYVLEITDIVDALYLENALETKALEVRIVPIMEVPEEAQVSIGRVTVFRQGR